MPAGANAQDTNNNSPQSRSLSMSIMSGSDGCFCRICHDGDEKEALMKPCYCAGTTSSVHRSCIEKWLTMSNSECCEICKFTYILRKKPRKFIEWLREPTNPRDQRHLLGDIICFLLLTPLASVSTWLCLMGILHYIHWQNTWEAVGLVSLTMFLVLIYLIWCIVSVRYHFKLWRQWRRTNQKIAIVSVERDMTCVDSNVQKHVELSLKRVAVAAGAGGEVGARGEEFQLCLPRTPSPLEDPATHMYLHPLLCGGATGPDDHAAAFANTTPRQAFAAAAAAKRPRTRKRTVSSSSGGNSSSAHMSPHDDNSILQRLFPQEFDGVACEICKAKRGGGGQSRSGSPRGGAAVAVSGEYGPGGVVEVHMPDLVQSVSGPRACAHGNLSEGPAVPARSAPGTTPAARSSTDELSFIETAL